MCGTRLFPMIFFLTLAASPAWAVASSSREAALVASGTRFDGIEASSRVVAVTVFRDRARVTRSAAIDLQAGEQRVVFKGLPPVLEPETARVSGQGAAGIVIRSLELRRDVETAEPGPEIARIQTQIDHMEHDRALLQERLKSVDFLRDLLTQFRGSLATAGTGAAGGSGAEPVAGRVDLDMWGRGYVFLSDRLDAIATEKLRLEASIVKAGHDIDTRQAALSTAAHPRRDPTWIAEVVLAASRAGSATLSLTYLSADASWSPVYDARLLPAEGRLTLAAFAQVRQETGEDWLGVELTLSSTRPLALLDLPNLASLHVRRVRGRELTETVKVRGMVDGVAGGVGGQLAPEVFESLPVLGRNGLDVLTLAPGVADVDGNGSRQVHGARDTNVVTLPSATAALETRSAGVVFRLPGRLDLPSDGQSHRHLILERDLVTTVEYRAAPALDRSVYLVARSTLPADLTLPPGSVQHFVDEDLVGRSLLPGLPGGSPLDLGFGPEERIVVERREREKRTPKGGDDVELRRLFSTTLRNQLGRTVTVILTERLPISDDAAIRVALDDPTTDGGIEDERDRGVYRWSLTLPSEAGRDFHFAYTVRSPRGQALELASARP